jgi:hypothetical protein
VEFFTFVSFRARSAVRRWWSFFGICCASSGQTPDRLGRSEEPRSKGRWLGFLLAYANFGQIPLVALEATRTAQLLFADLWRSEPSRPTGRRAGCVVALKPLSVVFKSRKPQDELTVRRVKIRAKLLIIKDSNNGKGATDSLPKAYLD